MIATAVALGFVIGLVVGSVGGGGAILALPVLVYVLGEPVAPATTASLVVVAVAAAVGAGALAAEGHVCWRIALTFAAPAAAGALLGTIAGHAVSAALLIALFVPVMVVAAFATWARAGRDEHAEGTCPDVPLVQVVVAGLLVGTLTGFFGVGGGFLTVPVLVWFGTGFRNAVATSLVVVTITCLVALVTHLLAGSELDPGVTAALALPTALGAYAGTRIARRLPQAQLGRAFALVVLAVATFLLVDLVALDGPPGA